MEGEYSESLYTRQAMMFHPSVSYRRYLSLFFGAITFVGFLPFVLKSGRQFGRDWDDYFEPLSLFIRSAVLKFHSLPIYNPWRCGGSDFLGNPQARLLSPLVLLDIFLPPWWSILLTFAIFGLLGLWSMYVCARAVGISRLSSAICAVFFVNGSWFALHFAEGHLVYAPMQCLPFFFLLGMRWRSKRYQLALALTSVLLVYEGAIQALIYGMVLVILGAVYARPRGSVDRRFIAWLSLATISAIFAKAIPVLMTIRGRTPELERTSVSLEAFFQIFFNPAQSLQLTIEGLPFGFHEFGCYIGILATTLVIYRIAVDKNRETRFFELALLIFLWMAMGWGGWFNPWAIWQRIPVFNFAHIQSRLLVLFLFFFSLLLGLALAKLESKRALWAILSAILLIEGMIVRWHVIQSLPVESSPALGIADFIPSTTIKRTIPEGMNVEHLMTPDRGAISCNDKAFFPRDIRHDGEKEYRGAIYTREGTARATLIEVRPNRFRFEVNAETPAEIGINNNHAFGWKVVSGNGRVVSRKRGENIRLTVPAGRQEITLRYSPQYSWVSLLLALFGIGLFARLAAQLPGRVERQHT